MKLSKLTLGTVALGMDYGIANRRGKPPTEQSVQILSAALAAGINCVDTARDYGTAEQLIGAYREQYRPPGLEIVTKFKIQPGHIGDRREATAEAIGSLRQSLGFLGLKRARVCLFHMDRDLPIEKVLAVLFPVLEELKSRDLIGLAGISVDHPREATHFAEHPLIDALQIPVNILDQRLVQSGLIAHMGRLNKVVFARSIFLQGLFFLDPGHLKGKLRVAGPYISQLGQLAFREGLTIAQLAFSYVRDLPGVTSMVFGAENDQQVKSNTGLLEGAPLSEEAGAEISALALDVPEDIITPRNWHHT